MTNRHCVPNPECKYYLQGCFVDKHHVYRQSEANTDLKRRFGSLGENVVNICRATHEMLEAEHGWPEYPDSTTMLDAVTAAVESGEIFLSQTIRRKIYGNT